MEQLHRDNQEHVMRIADLTRELEAEETRGVDAQSRMSDLVQHSVRLQEALVVVQSQLHDAKHVISVYEDRISRLEYDAVSKRFPSVDDADALADFSLSTYPSTTVINDGMSLPYDLIEGPAVGTECEDTGGVEERKGQDVDADGSTDGQGNEQEYDYGGVEESSHNGSYSHSEAVETDGSEDGAEVGVDSACDVGSNDESEESDEGSEADRASEVDDRASQPSVADADADAEADGVVVTGNPTPLVPSSTTRRVILKKGGGGSSSIGIGSSSSSSSSAGSSATLASRDMALVARVKAMTARDMSRLTVPELTQLLEALGKSYCKPKAAAVALLMTTAKDL